MGELLGRALLKMDDATVLFNSPSTIPLVTVHPGTWLLELVVNIRTAFDTTGVKPSLQVGVSGTPGKYGTFDLTQTGSFVMLLNAEITADEVIEITYSPGVGGTVGRAVVLMSSTDPR